MPPRKGPEAEAIAAKVRESRWRYLLRYPDFRAELNELRRHYREGGGYSAKHRDFWEKWELEIPSQIVYPWSRNYLIEDLSSETVELYESLLERVDRDFLGSAVSADDPYNIYGWGEYGPPPRTDPGPGPGRFLEIEVDLSYPDDVILSLINEELRKARQEHTRSRQRQRPDKVDFYLKIYDLAERGDTFGVIAKALKKRVSTVKSAFLTARRNIFGSAAAPTKKSVPLADFNKYRHFDQCSVCKAAERFEEMCPAARLYTLQDHESQRDVTGHDTVHESRGPR